MGSSPISGICTFSWFFGQLMRHLLRFKVALQCFVFTHYDIIVILQNLLHDIPKLKLGKSHAKPITAEGVRLDSYQSTQLYLTPILVSL